MCMTHQTSMVMTLSEWAIHPCAQMTFLNGLYLLCFNSMAQVMYQSCVNVNMN